MSSRGGGGVGVESYIPRPVGYHIFRFPVLLVSLFFCKKNNLGSLFSLVLAVGISCILDNLLNQPGTDFFWLQIG